MATAFGNEIPTRDPSAMIGSGALPNGGNAEKAVGGRWLISPGTQGTTTLTANTIFVPMSVGPMTIDVVGFEVTTLAGAGSLVRLGLYDVKPTEMVPGALLVDCGTADATTLGVKQITLATPFVWGGGVLWVSVTSQGTPTPHPVVRSLTSSVYAMSVAPPSVLTNRWLTQSGITGALPAVANNDGATGSGVSVLLRGV